MSVEAGAVFVECPLVNSLEGHDFPSRRLAKLAGVSIELTRLDILEEQMYAVFTVSNIIAALDANPEQFYWKGYFSSLQPRSYGIVQAQTHDPELSFLCVSQSE